MHNTIYILAKTMDESLSTLEKRRQEAVAAFQDAELQAVLAYDALFDAQRSGRAMQPGAIEALQKKAQQQRAAVWEAIDRAEDADEALFRSRI